MGAGPTYLVIALTLTYVGYSIVILAQMGLSALMSPEYHERSRVFAWWQFFNIIGVFLALALPAALVLLVPGLALWCRASCTSYTRPRPGRPPACLRKDQPRMQPRLSGFFPVRVSGPLGNRAGTCS